MKTSAVILASLIALASLLFILSPAFAHSWYPHECCHDKDCAEIADNRVRQDGAGGYIVDGKFPVHRSQVKTSPDGHYHACFPNPDLLLCFFAPQPNS